MTQTIIQLTITSLVCKDFLLSTHLIQIQYLMVDCENKQDFQTTFTDSLTETLF